MNEATAASPAAGRVVDMAETYVGQLRSVDPENDPRLVRWGYNPGQRKIWIPGRKVGSRDRFVPLGEFIPMTTFETPQENCTLDEYKEKEINVDVTAQDVQVRYMESLGVWGFQSFFYGEMDVIKVYAINDIILPTLQEIRALAEVSPIPLECDGEDEMDLAAPRTHCAKCHLQWIDSPTIEAYMAEAVTSGYRKSYIDLDGKSKTRLVKPTMEELETVRDVVRKGLKAYIIQAAADWGRIVGEYDNGERKEIYEPEHFLRKDLHQMKPQNKEVEMVERMAKATTGNTNDILAELTKSQIQIAQGQAQTNALLAALVTNNSPVDTKAEKKPANAVKTNEKETEQ
jgi:hypothetical protein